MDKQIIVYEPTEQVKMEVKTAGETVWLTIDQMAMLFGRDKSVIGKHVRNVFAEGELPEEGFRQILPKTSVVGGRPFAIYNLDVVISVGYRVKSFEGTRFRQWATRVLSKQLVIFIKPIYSYKRSNSKLFTQKLSLKTVLYYNLYFAKITHITPFCMLLHTNYNRRF